jgi:hypothetical protein
MICDFRTVVFDEVYPPIPLRAREPPIRKGIACADSNKVSLIELANSGLENRTATDDTYADSSSGPMGGRLLVLPLIFGALLHWPIGFLDR